MAMHKTDIKSRYGSVMQFSTGAATAGATALQFSSAEDAANFLAKHFSDYNYAKGLLTVAGWMDIGGINLQVYAAKQQLFLQLGQAIQQARLFVRELPAPERQQDSAPQATTTKASAAKTNKPGGGAQGNSNADAAPAASNEPGTNGSGNKTPKNSEVECAGDPVSMCTGEEILELIDFDLSGPLPLQFKRTYRSSQCHEQLGLGYGWRSNFHLHIEATDNAANEPRLVLHDDEGRRLFFTPVAPGQTSHQLAEGLALRHEDNGSQVLLRPDNTHWVFVPANTDIKQPKRWVLHQIFDSLGNVLQLYYDRYQRLSRIDYTRKRGIELHYDKQGLISRIEAVENTPEGLKALDVVLAQYHFDAQRDLIAATNQAGQTEHYGYQGHLLAVRQRASGFKHYFSWLGEGPAARCSRNWGDDGYYDYKFQYDDSQRLTLSTDSRGQRWQYFHNERNQLIKKIAPDGAIWRYTWNNQGKKIAETAPNGAATRYYYNDVGQLVTVEQADGAISHFQYNELGQRTGFTDAEGQHWRREYSAGGLLKAQYQPDGSSSRYQYNTEGQLTQLQHADGRIEQYLWNDEGQLLARKQGDAVSRYSYDKLGRLNGIADAAGLVTEYQRNTAGNVTEIRQYPADAPEQVSVEQLSYDAAGRLISKTNAQGEQSQWQYEGLAQPTALIQADGSRFSYEYDKERNLTAIMRSDGARYQLDYDGLERPVKLQGFDGRVQHYQYDIAGHVSNVADGSKRQVKLKRDSLGRITEQTALFGQQLASNHFHYDKLGRPLRASNAQRKLRFSYHANGQLSEHWQDDWRTVHQYDNAGRRLSTILPDGTALDYRYNEQGLLSQLAVNQQPVMWRSFDNAGRETAREYQSGLQLNQQFDAFNRLTAQHWQLGEKSRQRQYRYSTLHQLLAVTDNQSGDIEYQYNKLDQLVSKQHSKDASQNEQHQWDSFGNPTGEGIEVQQDRLLRYHDNQYQYDDNGNQLTALAAGKRQQRQFNGFNQLTGLQDVSGVTRYEYDAFGRRSAKITAAGRTDYLWEGNTLIGEYCQGEYRWYVFEPNSNKPLALISRGQLYFYQLDQLGTPLSLTDSENNIVWQAHYSVFGKATVTVNDIHNPIRFQGQYYDNESGLHYNHFRYYDPQTGRFISQDPIGLLGGINHYQYAPNHINWIDPLGLCAKEEGDSYEARKAALANSNGAMTTLDAFSEEHATGAPWDKAAVDENWITERQELHKRIIDTAMTEVLAKTQVLVGAPAIHAMRGNTGAGKSRLMKSGAIPELANGDIAVSNPDNFKPVLINEAKKDGISLTHNQTHWEAAMLSNKLKSELLKPENKEQVPSIIVDKRLGGLYELKTLHKEGLETGRQVNVFDVDAPLEMSLLGVLMREPGGEDPIVPFNEIAGGFEAARNNRKQFIEYYKENPELGRYELYGTAANGEKKLVAKVTNGKFIVEDNEELANLTRNPADEIQQISTTIIDNKEIERVTSGLPESDYKSNAIKTLNSKKGMTWKEAVTLHGEVN